MKELGMKDKLLGKELLKPLIWHSRPPTGMPRLSPGEKVICGFNQGLGERMIVCDNLADMLKLDAAYAKGGAIEIKWYICKDPGVIIMISLTPAK